MFRLYVYSVLSVLIGSVGAGCSSEKEWDPKSLGSTMAVLEEEKKVEYGVQLKGELAARAFFVDKASDFGLENIEATGIMAVDLNNDGHSDLVFIEDYFSQPVFYLFNPSEKKFRKHESLFDESIKASSVLFYDLTGDRVTDALVMVMNQGAEVSERPLRLFEGYLHEGVLRFKPSALNGRAFSLRPGPAATLGLVDYDLDGDLDIFVGNWFSKTQGVSLPEKDVILENKNGKFRENWELLEGESDLNPDGTMAVNAAPTFSSQICDVDLNGFPDILTTSTNGYLNKLWMNLYKSRSDERRFKNYGVESSFAGDPDGILNSRGGGRTFSAACADYNNDGIMDAFLGELSHNHDADSIDRSSILTGSSQKFPPKFIRTEYVLDAHDLRWNQSDKRGIWFDFNNDGLLDLWVDNSGYPPHTRTLLFKQHPDHSFENVAKEAGVDIVNPLSSVLIDVNKDGKMDVLTSQSSLRDARIKQRLYLFVNQDQNENNAVRFFLRGNKANHSGLNATVELRVKTDQGISRRTQQISYSYGGLNPQNEEGVLFGLKKGESLLSVKVIWPYSKTLNAGRAGLEKFYELKDLKAQKAGAYAEVTLCEIGIHLLGRKDCPLL